MAIYDDLSDKIESIKQMDFASLEEKLKPLQMLAVLADKLDNLQPLDYDVLAEKVAEKFMPEHIDYDVLAGKVAALVTGGAAAASGAQLASVENKIEEVQRTLTGAVSVKQLPEFKKLDALIAEYLKTLSYDLLPDILVTAESIKNTANRYIVSGNNLRGETMLSDLRMRLTRVNVWGASALAAVNDAIRTNKLPVPYSEEAFKAFSDACAELEQGPALADDELAGKVARAKDALFNDADQRIMDRETLAEMAAVRESYGTQEGADVFQPFLFHRHDARDRAGNARPLGGYGSHPRRDQGFGQFRARGSRACGRRRGCSRRAPCGKRETCFPRGEKAEYFRQKAARPAARRLVQRQ